MSVKNKSWTYEANRRPKGRHPPILLHKLHRHILPPYRHRYYTYLLYKWIQPLHPPYRHCFYTFLIYIERERSSASGVPLESPFNFILINIFEIFLWYSIRMKLIIYEIRAKTMSVTGGVLESLRQVKKQCVFHFTLWLDHSDIIVFLHIYTTNIWHFRIYV